MHFPLKTEIKRFNQSKKERESNTMADNIIETKLPLQIKEVLSKFPKYWDNDDLLRNKITEDLRSYDEELIKALLSNELIKDAYSITLDTATIFKIEDFISMLRYKNYWGNSYTKYSNKIGLTSDGKYLNYNTDVVLDFPHKDSVLEGGMSTEDKGKEEIYYHNILAKEEIDILLSPKIFTNIKKYNNKGEYKPKEFTDEDNLIIKGNNLIALHTLNKKIENKVKFIYIDPPYNTGNDSFRYNDQFNHSTWLIFMKNRLEIAKKLLSEDGIIAVQTDYHESAYIRVLLDEIFGRKAQVADIAVKMSTPSGPKMAHINSRVPKLKDSIAIYAKGEVQIVEQPYKPKNNWDNEYSKILMNFKYDDFLKLEKSTRESNIQLVNDILKNVKLSTLSKEFSEFRSDLEWLHENAWRIVADKQNTGIDRLLSELNKDYRQDIEGVKSKMGNIVLFRTDKDFGKDTRVEIVFAINNLNEHTGDLWTDISTSGGFSEEGGVNFPTAKKPEKLLQRIIGMFTKPGDIVLDFFMGSATTQAVSMKMGRRFIGIEQMDYINSVSVPRLQNVINGEQSGISKDVDWEGGGSFVYAELYSLNDEYIKGIKSAANEEDLEKVLSFMKERAYLNFKVDLERVTLDDEEYKNLSLEEKKKVLIQILDLNQLYLGYSEIDDQQYNISEEVKEFNHSFYKDDKEKNEW